MTFLEFPDDDRKRKTSNSKVDDKSIGMTTNKATRQAESILSRVPPKIEPMKSSEVLSRAAAFLPQLAASNRAILQKRPEDVNIEMLSGTESEIIEMKLGLGVFEEKTKRENESETDDSDSESDKKILILPSEIRAAAEEQKQKMDPFEKVINSLLFFATTDDEEEEEEEEGESEEDDESMEILDFE